MTRGRFTSGFLFGCLVALCTCSCGADGTDPYSLWQIHRHPDDVFRFYYLSPPWTQDVDFDPVRPVMRVDRFAEPRQSGLDARIRLEAWSESGSERQQLLLDRQAYWAQRSFVVELLDYQNSRGDEGSSLDGRTDDEWVTEIVHDFSSGAVVLSLWGFGTRDDADVELLVDGFSPGSLQEN